MKIWNRVLGVGLSAALLTTALAGCSGNPAPGVSPSASPSASASADNTLGLVDTIDVIDKLIGIPRDTVVATVDGIDVTAEDFLYSLYYASSQQAGTTEDGLLDWGSQVEGQNLADYLMDSAMEFTKFYAVMEAKAKELGVAISDETRSALDQQILSTITNVGGIESYARRLQGVGMSDAGFRRLNELDALYSSGALAEKLYGPGSGSEPTDEDLIALADEYGMMLAKHILIKTVDDAGTALPDAEKAAAKEKAEGLLAQLQAASAEDLPTLFDTLMNEHSEDGRDASGNLGAPDGYLFGDGKMVPEFEEGTKALAYNQLSGLVETTYGYHIILRLPPVNDEVRQAWTMRSLSDTIDQWIADAKVVTNSVYDSINPQTFYDGLTAYQAELTAEEQAAAAASASPSASPSASATPAG